MTRHISTHSKKKTGKDTHFIMRIDGGPSSPFWMYIQIPCHVTFRALDKFLRIVWLECCGHLSEFSHNLQDIIGMKNRLDKILTKGDVITHLYDFGSSTELRLTVIAKTPRVLLRTKQTKKDAWTPPPLVYGEDVAEIIALHDRVKFTCGKCKNEATLICPECGGYDDTDDGMLCDSCGKNHRCDIEMMLPIAQSPRMGVCGFEGGSLG